jgi:hypothetical protein
LAEVLLIMLRSLESYKGIFKRGIIWFDITDEKSSTVYPLYSSRGIWKENGPGIYQVFIESLWITL